MTQAKAEISEVIGDKRAQVLPLLRERVRKEAIPL